MDKDSLRAIYRETMTHIYRYWQVQDGPMPVAPSLIDVMKMCGLKSKGSTTWRLLQLKNLGLVEESDFQHRGIRLTREGYDLVASWENE